MQACTYCEVLISQGENGALQVPLELQQALLY